MRRLLPLIIIFILLLGVIGYFPLLKLKQLEIRREIRAHLHSPLLEEALCTISVMQENKQQLTWEEEGVEFKYEGQMYDVVDCDTLNGVIQYHCLADQDETALLNRLDRVLEDESLDPPEKTLHKLIKLLFSFLYVLSDGATLTTWSVASEVPMLQHNLRFSDFVKDITLPPK